MKLSLKNFIFDNKFKGMTIRAYIYSAIFRYQIKFVKPKKMRKNCRKAGKKRERIHIFATNLCYNSFVLSVGFANGKANTEKEKTTLRATVRYG